MYNQDDARLFARGVVHTARAPSQHEGQLVFDYNYNGEGTNVTLCFPFISSPDRQAGEDFDADLALPNIDFGTYVCWLLLSCPLTERINVQHIYPQLWFVL